MKQWIVFGMVCALTLDGSAQMQRLWEREFWSQPGEEARFYNGVVDAQEFLYLGGTLATQGGHQPDALVARYTPEGASILLLNYAPDGTLQWIRTYLPSPIESASPYSRLLLDPAGNLVVFGGLYSSQSGRYLLVLKYSPDMVVAPNG